MGSSALGGAVRAPGSLAEQLVHEYEPWVARRSQLFPMLCYKQHLDLAERRRAVFVGLSVPE
jgi:hypothetical protein